MTRAASERPLSLFDKNVRYGIMDGVAIALMSRNTKILIGILVISIALFVYVAPQWINAVGNWKKSWLPESVAKWIPTIPEAPFSLGLDLVGGADLLYKADFTGLEGVDRADAMQGVRDVVERRVNYFGVSEPVVQIIGEDRLSVQLAGITDVNQAIKLIGETPLLEFLEPSGVEPQYEVDEQGNVLVADPYAGWKQTGLSGKQLSRAQLVFDPQTNQPEVSLEFNDEGAALFAQITKRNIGQPVAIFLDGFPISIPTVQTEIADGNAVITGSFTPAEAKELAIRLNSGALPVPITLISQRTVGASLGEESLRASLIAGLWAMLLVAVFMVVLYRLPGAVSIVALTFYLLVTLAIYKFLPVTMTMAGIAGFILSLGIGVDAKVLIFARMREEMAAGKPLMVGLLEGFRRSWPSIRDSHVTTFIGAAVLYLFTTSLVKGFALTLGIGVLLSLFTSTVVTRAFLIALANTKLAKNRWIFS